MNITREEFEKRTKELEWMILMYSGKSSGSSNNLLSANNTFTGTNMFTNKVTIPNLQILNLYAMCNSGIFSKGNKILFKQENRNGYGFTYEDGVCKNLYSGYYKIDLEMDLINIAELSNSSWTFRIDLVINDDVIKSLVISGGRVNSTMTLLTKYLDTNSEISIIFSDTNQFNSMNASYCNLSVSAIRVGNT